MPTPKPPAAPQIRDLPPMTAGRFRVILADPPWPYVTFSPKDKGRRAEATMTRWRSAPCRKQSAGRRHERRSGALPRRG